MAKGTKAEFLALLELCQALAPGLQAEDGARLSIIMLDLCFYLERFADALAIVEQKIPGRDSQWSRSLVSKIKAHLCLQQGKPREAVAHFREFMNAVAQDQADQIDPVSGTRVTKEMILGLNAKRIGDILAADGDKDGAAKAYQEARDAYTAALKGFSEGSSEYTKITNDRAAVPGGAGN
jgi:predicted negative regulator of RcsB-dependent stress response